MPRPPILWQATLFCVLLSVALPGCAVERPDWFHPGPTLFQQQQAVLHDPYADRNLGPEVVGGRPRDFQYPQPEPVRNQWRYGTWLPR
jgi:hypothetical protein